MHCQDPKAVRWLTTVRLPRRPKPHHGCDAAGEHRSRRVRQRPVRAGNIDENAIRSESGQLRFAYKSVCLGGQRAGQYENVTSCEQGDDFSGGPVCH